VGVRASFGKPAVGVRYGVAQRLVGLSKPCETACIRVTGLADFKENKMYDDLWLDIGGEG